MQPEIDMARLEPLLELIVDMLVAEILEELDAERPHDAPMTEAA